MCSTHTAVPTSGLITDFSEFTAGTTDLSTGSKAWGGTSILNGTTFVYGTAGVTLNATINANGKLELKVSLPNNDFVGFGLTFNICGNASAFSGISALIGGSLGNATLVWQLQTNNDTPIDTTTGRGKCTYTTGSMWTDCGYNSFTIPGSSVSSTPATLRYAWSQFTGGKPVATVETNEIIGTQWQLECRSGGTCTVDITIDDVKFY